MKRRRLKIAALLALIPLLGLAVAASGIIPINASSPHWAVTRALLHFSKERSVALHAPGGEAFPLDEPWLVMKGAGHYHAGCLACHGGPDRSTFLQVARAMMPEPPDLRPRIAAWKPEELFYIVKHGIKLTGMPAWPSQHRDDEVRAMVAFLLALPGLGPDEYRRLVHGDSERELAAILGGRNDERAAPAALVACARCHGTDGRGRGGAAFPKLAGRKPEYLTGALQAFARGERHSGIMGPVAASLSSDEIRTLADYYGSLVIDEASAISAGVDSAEAIERGRKIAADGDPSRRVASCIECHGPGADRRNPAYPDLAGQYADYLVLQLELFKTERRGGSPYAHLMSAVAPRMTREQMRDVSLYYASLHPRESR
jgi:cytochrome c553